MCLTKSTQGPAYVAPVPLSVSLMSTLMSCRWLLDSGTRQVGSWVMWDT